MIVLMRLPAVEHLEQRDDQRLGRHHLHEQDRHDEGLAAAEAEAGRRRPRPGRRWHSASVTVSRVTVRLLRTDDQKKSRVEHLAVVVERAGEGHELRVGRLDVDAAPERRVAPSSTRGRPTRANTATPARFSATRARACAGAGAAGPTASAAPRASTPRRRSGRCSQLLLADHLAQVDERQQQRDARP